MKYFERSSVYDSDWASVTSAFWIKYPNEKSSHVKTVDTIGRSIDEENGILRVRRLIALEYCMPKWMERFFGIPMHGLALEETMVDNKKKILELKSCNLGLSRFLTSEEICIYKQHPDDPNKTIYETKLGVTVKIAGYMQGLLESQFLTQAAKKFESGLEVMRGKITETKSLYSNPTGLYGGIYWNDMLQQMKEEATQKAAATAERAAATRLKTKEKISDSLSEARISLKTHADDAKEKFAVVRQSMKKNFIASNNLSSDQFESILNPSTVISEAKVESNIALHSTIWRRMRNWMPKIL